MICALEFVPPAAMRRDPLRYELSAEEEEQMRAAADMEEGELEAAAEAAGGASAEDMEDEDSDGFEDEEEDEGEDGNGETDEHGLSSDLRMDEYDTDAGVEALSSAHGAATTGPEISDDEGSDAEENAIEATDMVLLAARTDDDSSVLEVHCYDPLTGNLWVHHDLALGAFPLCTAFLDVPPLGANANGTASAGDAGAYVAVGTFKPGIEIWNLDVLDPLEPSAILGGEDPSSGGSKKGGKKKKKLSLKADSHTDAVMGLAWNRLQRQVLASGSADCTVKLWDVSSQQCSTTLTHHGDKVQALAWHPTEAAVLATASYDKTVAVLDARAPKSVCSLAFSSDLEAIAWDPHKPERLVGSCDDGTIRCYDPRYAATPLWSLQAHPAGQAVSAVSFAPHVAGLLATASTDKTVKLWDVHAAAPAGSSGGGSGRGSGGGGGALTAHPPVCVASRDMAVGKLFGLGWCYDPAHPWGLACAGSKATLALWFCDESAAVPNTFGSRVVPAAAAAAATAAAAAADGSEASNAELAVDSSGSHEGGDSASSGGDGTSSKGVNAKKKDKKKTVKKAAGAK